MSDSLPRNVLGTPLQPCCTDPMTGYYRDGYCRTGPGDMGVHVVCAEMTEAFLDFTRLQGNDLTTPMKAFDFPGLRPGDRWCLCAQRWQEAYEADVAPPVILEATHIGALEFADLDALKAHAIEAGA
ncbi:MAG: DUF2237 domain-containing protein [Phycisphaerales bacterium]|nr:MAG: DUF2237 domain-containing protein [Phycisphaerales bacterium]